MTRHTGIWLLLTALALAACSSDDEGQSGTQQKTTLQILSCQKDFSVVDNAVTRSLPPGFTTAVTPEDGLSLMLFLTMGTNDNSHQGEFFYYANDGKWRSDINTIADLCHIYGYMPSTSTYKGNIAPLNDNYAEGTVMTFTGLPAITTYDPCIITGIKQIELDSPNSTLEDFTKEDVKEGSFEYTIRASQLGNFLYVLLDHLYAGLEFRFQVKENYAKLRTIKLKKVELKATQAATVSPVVTLRANTTGASPIEGIVWHEAGSETEYEIFKSDDGEKMMTAFSDSPVATAYFAPLYSGTQSMTMRCTYDVYAADGTTLVSENRQAENRISQVAGMTRGKKRIITVTVNPTYLYILADPDLDNPTITID